MHMPTNCSRSDLPVAYTVDANNILGRKLLLVVYTMTRASRVWE